MKYNRKRLLWSLGIGFVIMLPILYVYGFGEGSEDTVVNSIASVLMMPAMLIAMPLLLLAPFFSNPDKYVLGAFFYSIPFLAAIFYTACAYGVLPLIAKKK